MLKINNEDDYALASQRADALYGAPAGSAEKEELDELLDALKAYEQAFIRMLRENG